MEVSTTGKVVVVLIVAVLLGGLWWAGTLIDTGEPDGDVALSGSSPVERLLPPRNAEILAQEPMGVDLRSGWTGVLVLNGQEIPQDQVQDDNLASTGELLFTPGPGKVVEDYLAGENCANVIAWRVEESRDNARTASWCFNVT